MKIFLDDLRVPYDKDFVVARTDHAFKRIILDLSDVGGSVSMISFDHDLGEHSMNGYELAHWLIAIDMDHGVLSDDFQFIVHSANPVGRENIERLLTNYLRHKKET
ncbi:MAG: hypothetical protein D6698_17460 [Gammaproteobacteria bacterium]|nr:MAG: hypothetical protein D6698_17460 [Gammaproteobacteria bacterium]